MSDTIDAERRRLLAFGLLAAGGWRCSARAASRAGADAIEAPLCELEYGQVQFGAGPLYGQARENHRLVLGLDEDALLRPFRARAGQHAPGPELGGWYGTNAFAPGATFGQWMSALSRYHAITGDAPTRAKLRRLVRAYAATVDAEGSFYRKNRFPAYTYDKLVGGLLDAHRLSGDEAALATLARTTRAAVPYLPPRAMPRNEHAQPGEDFSEHAWDESYTLPENQFHAWKLTGDARHLDLARRFLYDEFFAALARGDNVLPGKHAYSHVNGLSSAAQAHLSLGTPMYLAAAQQGFEMISAQSFATGGWGPDEHFVVPDSGALRSSLDGESKSFETPCGAYAHFKLTRYLLRMTRGARYGDSMERVLYNTVLGALPIQPDGHAFYYSDYTRRARKTFHPDRWPCCSGTLPMIAADYTISTCFTDPQGIYVNLYVPAQVAWTQNDAACGLSIQTNYPYASTVFITLQLPRAQTFTLNLRIPAWAQGAGLSINGRREAGSLEPGRFAALRREWRSADRIELELPLTQRLESIEAAHPQTVALMAGPLVLMRVLDEQGSATSPVARTNLLAAQRDRSGRHEWHAQTDAGLLRLKPFLDIEGESYSVYQEVLPS
ncbi:MAG TPA: beta-L-arabinofuranosidase domain-containing protein [Steroidobacteraceae bacterium]|nr:beta-L-arabinofuranosidase domain-containing protein [Steroidobacteraceae bacterium]